MTVLKLLKLTLLLAIAGQSASMPPELLGRWKIGKAYSTHNVIGINAKQEARLEKLEIDYSASKLRVCGKTLEIKLVKRESVTAADFFAAYEVRPSEIGLSEAKIISIELEVEPDDGVCGAYRTPGIFLFEDARHHFTMLVEGDYFPLKRPI